MGPRVAVIGGGISGLAAANRLRELDPAVDVVLLEAGPRVGGVLETVERDGFLLEAAADNFLVQPSAALDLCHRLGLGDALIRPQQRHAQVVHRGRLEPIPTGFMVLAPSRIWPVLRSRVLSPRGKLRMALEYFVPPRRDERDESLASFVRRRFGREVFERLVQPLVGGIYTADAERLSIDATMPRFRRMEREHGSVLRAMWQQRRSCPADAGSGARYGQFVALRGGMSSLVRALAARLPAEAVQLNSPVVRIVAQDGARWRLNIGGDRPRQLDVDAVVVAAPPRHAASLLQSCSAPLARSLAKIGAASCAVVSLGYRREQFAQLPNAAGLVVPLVEQRLILSCSYSSEKYEGRAPAGAVLLRVFIGGASQCQLLELRRWQLVELAEREVADLLGIRGEPILRHIVRQRHAMPQYHVGHRDVVTAINQQLAGLPTLALAGNALNGVGIPSCIESGETAATRVLSNLHRSTLLAVRQVTIGQR